MATLLGAIAWGAFGPLAQLVVQEGLFWERLVRYGLGVTSALATGDTVNIAARLEANGLAHEIQVSDDANRCLCDRYRFSDGHVIDLKGVGPTPARFLIDRNGSRV